MKVGTRYGREAVLTADVDLPQNRRARFHLDGVGHYARPDIFELYVKRVPIYP